MSVARNLSELRAQGEAKYKEKDYVTAAKFFKDAIGVFLDNRVAEPNCIEEFVKVASNLCMCYYSQKDLDNCVTTARELISVYPIVPKAFGCIGMCIMDRICEQDEQLSKSASGEDLRGNLQRYVVKVGGVLCSVDEAHTYLLRAVLLSNDTLKVTLGPYIDTAVRYVSEQLLSAPTPLERLGRGKVLDQCCPEEDGVPERPNTLSTSEVVMKPRLRLFDAATNAPIDLKDKHPTQEEMEAIVAASGAQEEPSPAAVSAAPIDFMLSDQPVPVRVCHSERGGLPRGLTLLRVESAFAISNWLKPKAGPVSTVRTGPDLSQGEIIHSHVDPTTGLEMGMVMMPDEHMGQGGEAPASVSCVCCGKEGSGGYAANYSFCQTCEAAAFCSPECRDKYRTRHDKYECPLLVKLREVMTLVRREKNAASKPKHKGANPRVEEIEDEAEAVLEEVKTDSDVLPGSGWTNSHLQRRTLPLTFAVYGGIMNKAPGWEKLLRVVERGVHHQVRCWIPEQTQRVLELMAPELPSFNKLPTKGKTEAADFLTTLFMLTRLYGVPRTDSDTCAFFVERTYFRHSCEPNCSWSDALRSYTTTRYVYKGEELRQAIDPDFPQHWPLQIRRKWLARHHGFLCKCDRCIREETRLNHARGDLSNDVTEQLLTADALKREGKAARHPTHHFHSALHKLIPTALLESPKSDAARQEMKELAAEMPSYLLHSHYLYEDLRHTLLQIALQENEPETAIKEGRASLLFLEALWPGSIPAKLARMQDLPMVFDTRRRRVQNRQLRRRQDINDHKSNTENGEQGEQQASSENTPTRPSSASTSTKRATRLRPQYARDFSEGTVVDQHIGSYHAWYCM